MKPYLKFYKDKTFLVSMLFSSIGFVIGYISYSFWTILIFPVSFIIAWIAVVLTLDKGYWEKVK